MAVRKREGPGAGRGPSAGIQARPWRGRFSATMTRAMQKFFIDRGGRVVRKLIGPTPSEKLTSIIDDLLAL